MRDSAQVRTAQLARSCARFLGRAPLVSRDRVSAESVATLARSERLVADLLRRSADALVAYTTGQIGAGDDFGGAASQFGADAAEVQTALDEDPALGVLRDVFADVVRDAAKVASAEPAVQVAVITPVQSTPRSGRQAKAVASAGSGSRRRRPAWKPPSETES